MQLIHTSKGNDFGQVCQTRLPPRASLNLIYKGVKPHYQQKIKQVYNINTKNKICTCRLTILKNQLCKIQKLLIIHNLVYLIFKKTLTSTKSAKFGLIT